MIMSEIELQLPALHHKTAAEDFKNEFFEREEKYIPGSAGFHGYKQYEDWLTYTENNRQEGTVSKDSVVVRTTFFAVRKCDNKTIGIIDIRHSLGEDRPLCKVTEYLQQFGGHIGYSVRPTERGKGYATEMLKMGLEYAKSLKIKKVMIGCESDNPQSIRTVEKCGGEFSRKHYDNGKSFSVYYVCNN
jgi:predicted acetyltransferase